MNSYYGYSEYYKAIYHISSLIKKHEVNYDLIVGIERGGLVAATHLSNILGIPLTTLKWSTKSVRDSSNQVLLTSRDKKVLLVDDILDMGDTFNGILETYWLMDTACLIYNKSNPWSLVPTYTHWTIDRQEFTDYIDFWWEKL